MTYWLPYFTAWNVLSLQNVLQCSVLHIVRKCFHYTVARQFSSDFTLNQLGGQSRYPGNSWASSNIHIVAMFEKRRARSALFW